MHHFEYLPAEFQGGMEISMGHGMHCLEANVCEEKPGSVYPFFFISLTMYSCIPSLHIKGRPVLLDEFSTVNYGDITSRWLNCWGGEGSKTQQLRICFGPVMSQFQGPLTK